MTQTDAVERSRQEFWLELANDFPTLWSEESDEEIKGNVVADEADSSVTHEEVSAAGVE